MTDSYSTIAAWKTYAAARGQAEIAAADDADLTTALLRGSEYVDGMFEHRFSGTRTDGRSQDRAWPRTDATDKAGNEIDTDAIPGEIVRAAYEAARRELASAGSLTPDVVLSERVTQETVVGAVSVSYADAKGVEAMTPILTVLEGILAPLIGKRTNSQVGFAARA